MNTKDPEFIVEKIRTQYTEKTDTALDEIKKLDKKVENPPIFLLRVGKVYPNQILG